MQGGGGGGQFRGSSVMGKTSIDTRSGPRIFVGKLNKETTENDVKVRTRGHLYIYMVVLLIIYMSNTANC
jgi:hypothetical protein